MTRSGFMTWLLPILFAVILIGDQLTKQIALQHLRPGVSVPFLGDFVRWTLVYNPGGAFSMRLGSPTYHLISSIVILIILLFYVVRHRRTPHIAIPLTIVAAGAVGNIIDRFRFGQVIDFIDCDFFDISVGSNQLDRWPIFKVADWGISCGIGATIFLMYYYGRKTRLGGGEQEIINDA